MQGNGQVAVVAMVQIALLPDGRIQCQAQCPGGRPQFNMMVETARQDALELFRAKEQGPAIEVAPAGLVIH